MSRISAGFGLVLAAIVFAGGLPLAEGGGRLSPEMTLGAGSALVLFGVLTLRGFRWGQVLLSLTGLGLLGWFLPVYFRTAHMWPYLALIILGSATFGLGILGVLLDGYESRESRPL